MGVIWFYFKSSTSRGIPQCPSAITKRFSKVCAGRFSAKKRANYSACRCRWQASLQDGLPVGQQVKAPLFSPQEAPRDVTFIPEHEMGPEKPGPQAAMSSGALRVTCQALAAGGAGGQLAGPAPGLASAWGAGSSRQGGLMLLLDLHLEFVIPVHGGRTRSGDVPTRCPAPLGAHAATVPSLSSSFCSRFKARSPGGAWPCRDDFLGPDRAGFSPRTGRKLP